MYMTRVASYPFSGSDSGSLFVFLNASLSIDLPAGTAISTVAL